ncbi:WD40 repeat domain-containing protein [Actinomadura rugatobispora]|uniref:WD40 repeat domain-containing protein n=1 Tax=Actinomadura rugatobispora TaxID=1994 RepID=A0ABW1A8V1_9ACTN|nr:hypothetical protein GCM10010200_017560 [Actinomadura rugatobispora]
MAFSRDGKLLAIGIEDETLLWDMATQTGIDQRLTSAREPLEFSADGKILATASTANSVQLWQL